jgi:hypothetical protein
MLYIYPVESVASGTSPYAYRVMHLMSPVAYTALREDGTVGETIVVVHDVCEVSVRLTANILKLCRDERAIHVCEY